jgi:hypothetical protein
MDIYYSIRVDPCMVFTTNWDILPDVHFVWCPWIQDDAFVIYKSVSHYGGSNYYVVEVL